MRLGGVSIAEPAIRPAIDAPARGGVELVGLSKRFGDVAAVEDVSLSVQPGELVALVGPSGCGKTTTLRLIAGLLTPSAGEIIIGGERMGNRPPYQRPVNTVFQSYALFPHLTVGENIAYGPRMAGVDRQERERRVAWALELVRLESVAHRKPAELSGGQQQRVALARALVNRPAVLLLDEPLGALDLKLRQAMQQELKRIQTEAGATFLYVTHDQDEALAMADRIAVMNAGRALQIGTPAEIYDQPRSRFVAGFIGQSNLLDGVVSATGNGLGWVTVLTVGELAGRLTGMAAAGAPATIAIRPERLVVRGAEAGEPGDGWSGLSGTLTEIRYVGSYWRLVVVLPNGQSLVAHRQLDAEEAEPGRPGERVRLWFRPRDAVVLTS